MPSSSSGSAQPAQRSTQKAPVCPVERECGACQHVGVPYAQQLASKDTRVAELFADVADASALRPILGMDEPYYYRNKVVSPYAPGRKLQGSANARREGRDARGGRDGKRAQKPRREILCGMYAAGSHRIVPTDGCLIENERPAHHPHGPRPHAALRYRAVPRGFRHGLPAPRRGARGTYQRRDPGHAGHDGRAFPASRAFCRELVRRCPRITSVVQNVNERQTNVILGEREQTLYGPGFILDKLCGLSFRISSQSFYQVNAVQTEVLYERAIDLAGFTGSETAIDAYCGTGTIGLVAAKRGARQVIGVDTVASAVRDARENAKHNGVENARFAVGDAGAFMRERAAAGDAVDVLLMDPPRAGSSEEFLAAAVTLAPRRIVYISCNPTTQVRDLAFLRQRGYAVRTVQPVDMFPHTDHIETIALVERVEGFFERSDR